MGQQRKTYTSLCSWLVSEWYPSWASGSWVFALLFCASCSLALLLCLLSGVQWKAVWVMWSCSHCMICPIYPHVFKMMVSMSFWLHLVSNYCVEMVLGCKVRLILHKFPCGECWQLVKVTSFIIHSILSHREGWKVHVWGKSQLGLGAHCRNLQTLIILKVFLALLWRFDVCEGDGLTLLPASPSCLIVPLFKCE